MYRAVYHVSLIRHGSRVALFWHLTDFHSILWSKHLDITVGAVEVNESHRAGRRGLGRHGQTDTQCWRLRIRNLHTAMLARSRPSLLFDLNLLVQESLLTRLARHLVCHIARCKHATRRTVPLHIISDGTSSIIVEHVIQHVLTLLKVSGALDVLLFDGLVSR